MRRFGVSALAVAVLAGAGACGVDGPKPGLREPCATASGPLGQCDPVVIDSAEDACWRMVECGALAVARPDDRDSCGYCDWTSCVLFIEELPDTSYERALDCVQAASCDALKSSGSPGDPDPPPCLDQGDF
jgi:hypothetical protein